VELDLVNDALLAQPEELLAEHGAVIVDCRFALADPQQGRTLFQGGHVPGACYLDLNEDMSGPVARRGGRHPLPDAAHFAQLLARHGIGPDTPVIAYDDSRFAFAARLWWLMRSLGYRAPRLLDGGYQAFLAVGGEPAITIEAVQPARAHAPADFSGYCDIADLREAQRAGALLVDSREEKRYQGLEEPIDPVAGHIPGAINRPWQGVTCAAGKALDLPGQREHWGDALESEQIVVYCGSGVTACVNLFSLALLGRDDATLYAGSWSDWCSYL
jgi:thiosulfate/3-mercaptopyruvate sulfurtransferase